MSAFITDCAKCGYSDFLIDIGANIGLISCQTGSHFDMVHMFEPNPLCVHILSVNASISLDPDRFKIHPVGIGSEQAELILTVPKSNWGGAFLKTDGNSYSVEVLAQKDGFSSFDASNYFDVDVEIVDAIVELKNLFAGLRDSGKMAGVIKIDVEGMEITVLNAIALTIPADVKAIIVFENWDNSFDPKRLVSSFGGRARLLVLDRLRPWPEGARNLRKIIGLLFYQRLSTQLVPWEAASGLTGDLVLEVAQYSMSEVE